MSVTDHRPDQRGEDGALPVCGASLRQDLGWLLMRASRGMSGVVELAMAQLSVDMRSALVLKAISTGAARTQLALAQVADIDKTTLVAVLDDLERRQLVRRVADPNDRRARIVELTDEGRRVVGWCRAAAGDVHHTILDALPPADRDALLRSLPLLIDAIDRVAAQADSQAPA